MKTSGIKIGIFPILGEVTWRFFFPFFRVFFPSFSWLISSPSCATTRAPPIIHSCSSLLLLFLFSDQAEAAAAAATEAAARTEAEQRQAETAEGGSTELHFSAVFRPLQAAIFEARSLLDSNL